MARKSNQAAATLIIRHMPDTEPPRFQVVRGADGKAAIPSTLPSPFEFPVKDLPSTNLIAELRWYLEDFLEYPFHPYTDRAERVLDSLKSWGTETFNGLFNSGHARDWYVDATRNGYQNLQLQIVSDNPAVLQWPWEALVDPEAQSLGMLCRMERRLNNVRDPMPISKNLPKDRINILLITARPYQNDLNYRSISRPLVELIEKNKIPAHVHVLRPPTFENLREHLKARPGFYHLIHFDGHGGFGSSHPAADPRHSYQGEGVLVFENEKGEPEAVTAEQLSALLREQAVPAMVLNACRSAMLDETAQDPFASVAASLVKAGIRSVVAMAYSLYVSGAEAFLPAFYKSLFETGNMPEAVRVGRQKMFEEKNRVCARGQFELRDFIVPVSYEQVPFDFSFANKKATASPPKESMLPEGAEDKENPYGFIGRDRELLKLERAIRKEAPAVLIHGLGGVGKTTLARGFLKWLADTEGMVGCLWLSFRDVRSAEFVLNFMGSNLFGNDFLVAGIPQKVEALAKVLKENPIYVVWDNFEVVAGIPGAHGEPNLSSDDRQILLSLLKTMWCGKGKIIITSRSEEDWLGVQRIKQSIDGLIGEERWEYCEKILSNLGISIKQDDPAMVELMNLLAGHPLAMRVILPNLEKQSATELIDIIRSNMQKLGPGAESLYATLRFVEEGLPSELRPLLILLGLHEGFVQADLVEQMAKKVNEKWTRGEINNFLNVISSAGLVRNIAGPVFELHPALTGFLRSTVLKEGSSKQQEPWTRAFVNIMGGIADILAPRPLHEQKRYFNVHGANFRFALSEAARLEIELYERAITQALAAYAQHVRNFSEAWSLFQRLGELAEEVKDKKNQAAAYHQLGMIAEERRDFETAEQWYLKSLAIKEKHGNEHGAAYHQLGMIAEERRDFKTAEKWYLKSLAINEKQGNEHGAANTYHQLGRIAQERGDFDTAEQWYLKAVAIDEKQGNEHGAAITYHQLGRIAQERRDFETAEKWYLKSLAIEEKQGNEHGTAGTYHQLGRIAEEQRDFETAEKWYLKSLPILERFVDEHNLLINFRSLQRLATIKGDAAAAEKWRRKIESLEKERGRG